MIFNVIWTLWVSAPHSSTSLEYTLEGVSTSRRSRSTPQAVRSPPSGSPVSCTPLGLAANEWIETFFLLLNLAIVFGSSCWCSTANTCTSSWLPDQRRRQAAAERPRSAAAHVLRTEKIDFEDPADDATFGRGRIEDFTWKGMLDMATCTECGRCQSQCPAWNTGKPLSPKLMIMDLRDHMFASAPVPAAAGARQPTRWVSATKRSSQRWVTRSPPAQRPLVGERDFDEHRDRRLRREAGHRSNEGPVIDVDALWSCTTCGACVEQCPR